jgi:Thiolase, N-terminal domain
MVVGDLPEYEKETEVDNRWGHFV